MEVVNTRSVSALVGSLYKRFVEDELSFSGAESKSTGEVVGD